MRPSGAWHRRRLAHRREEARQCTPFPPAASTCSSEDLLLLCWERSSSLPDAASPRPIHSDKPQQTPAGSGSLPQPFHLHAHTLAALCHQKQDLGERGGDKREMGSEEERVKASAWDFHGYACYC